MNQRKSMPHITTHWTKSRSSFRFNTLFMGIAPYKSATHIEVAACVLPTHDFCSLLLGAIFDYFFRVLFAEAWYGHMYKIFTLKHRKLSLPCMLIALPSPVDLRADHRWMPPKNPPALESNACSSL